MAYQKFPPAWKDPKTLKRFAAGLSARIRILEGNAAHCESKEKGLEPYTADFYLEVCRDARMWLRELHPGLYGAIQQIPELPETTGICYGSECVGWLKRLLDKVMAKQPGRPSNPKLDEECLRQRLDDGKSNHEIAKAYGVDRSTISKRCTRALERREKTPS